MDVILFFNLLVQNLLQLSGVLGSAKYPTQVHQAISVLRTLRPNFSGLLGRLRASALSLCLVTVHSIGYH